MSHRTTSAVTAAAASTNAAGAIATTSWVDTASHQHAAAD